LIYERPIPERAAEGAIPPERQNQKPVDVRDWQSRPFRPDFPFARAAIKPSLSRQCLGANLSDRLTDAVVAVAACMGVIVMAGAAILFVHG